MVKKRNGIGKKPPETTNPLHEFYVALRVCMNNIVKEVISKGSQNSGLIAVHCSACWILLHISLKMF